MLEVQKFIMEHEESGEWRELLSSPPYSLKIIESDKPVYENLVLLRYNQLDSKFSEKICRECRGLILEKGTWKVVRMAFTKFFNLGEFYAAPIAWESAVATSKEDGSLISLYYYADEWRVSTMGMMDAETASIPEYGRTETCQTFADLFRTTIKKYEFNLNELDKDCTYTFELCSKFNKTVVSYDTPQIFLTHIRNNKTLEEIPIHDKLSGIPKPEEYHLNSEKEYSELVNKFGPNREGIVVKDKYNNRVKIKTGLYMSLFSTVTNHELSLTNATKMVLQNECDEFLVYFKEYTDSITKLKELVTTGLELVDKINGQVDQWKSDNPNASRGDFAKMVKGLDTQSFASMYYLAYDGKDLKEHVRNIPVEKVIGLFGIQKIIPSPLPISNINSD